MNEVTELCHRCQKRNEGSAGGEGGQREREREREETHVVRPGLDLLVQLVLVLVPERRVTHKQDVEDHP